MSLIHATILIAVSYTHLDVYKRQGYGAYNYGSDTPINYYSGDVASNGTMYNSGWATDGYRGDGLEIPYSSTDAAANY